MAGALLPGRLASPALNLDAVFLSQIEFHDARCWPTVGAWNFLAHGNLAVHQPESRLSTRTSISPAPHPSPNCCNEVTLLAANPA
jgi:hypothetical protein